MTGAVGLAVIWLLLIVVLVRRLMGRRSRIGPGTAGAVYELLNEDKRKAIEIIVEQKTGERDPERAAGVPHPDRSLDK